MVVRCGGLATQNGCFVYLSDSFVYLGLWKYWWRSIGDGQITACCEWMRPLVSTNEPPIVHFSSALIACAMLSTVASDKCHFFLVKNVGRFCSGRRCRAGGMHPKCGHGHMANILDWISHSQMRKSHCFSFVPFRFLRRRRRCGSQHSVARVWIYGISVYVDSLGDKVQIDSMPYVKLRAVGQ